MSWGHGKSFVTCISFVRTTKIEIVSRRACTFAHLHQNIFCLPTKPYANENIQRKNKSPSHFLRNLAATVGMTLFLCRDVCHSTYHVGMLCIVDTSVTKVCLFCLFYYFRNLKQIDVAFRKHCIS